MSDKKVMSKRFNKQEVSDLKDNQTKGEELKEQSTTKSTKAKIQTKTPEQENLTNNNNPNNTVQEKKEISKTTKNAPFQQAATTITYYPSTTNIKKLYRLKLASKGDYRAKYTVFTILAGIIYLIASACYAPKVSDIVQGEYSGGSCLIIGSLFYLAASYLDLQFTKKQLETNIEVYDASYPEEVQEALSHKERVQISLRGFLSSQIGLFAVLHTMGAAVNLIGAVGYIPEMGYMSTAFYLMLGGELAIAAANIWRMVKLSEEEEGLESIDASEFEPLNVGGGLDGGKEFKFNLRRFNKVVGNEESLNAFFTVELLQCVFALLFALSSYSMPWITLEWLFLCTIYYCVGGLFLLASGIILLNKFFLHNVVDNAIFDDPEYKLFE